MCRRIKYKGQTVECEQTDTTDCIAFLVDNKASPRRQFDGGKNRGGQASSPHISGGQWRNDGVAAASSDGGPHWW